MADLTTQYTDAKNHTHIVQHLTVPGKDNAEKKQLAEEIYRILANNRNSGAEP